MSTRSYLSIGDVLSLLREEFPDVTISKIRFLESQGLVDPERSPSGYRKFYGHDVERLRWVLRQQRDQFLPLKVIRDRLAAAGDGVPVDELVEPDEPAGRDRSDVVESGGDPAEPTGGTGALLRSNGAGAQSGADRDQHASPTGSPVAAQRDKPSGTWARTGGSANVVPIDAERRQPVSGHPASPRSAAGLQAGEAALARIAGRAFPDPARPKPAGAGGRGGTDAGGATGTPESPGAPGGRHGDNPPDAAVAERAGAERAGAGSSRPGADPLAAGRDATVGREPRGGQSGGDADPAPGGLFGDPVTADSASRQGRVPPPGPVVGNPPSSAPDRRARPPADRSANPPGGRDGGGAPPEGGPNVLSGSLSGVSLTPAELSAATGLTPQELAGLEGFGLIAPMAIAGDVFYDEEALTVAKLVVEFAKFGIEPRHLRLYRNAVDREMGLVEQVITPLLRQRNPEARQRAMDAAAELTRLGQGLRSALVRNELRRQFGS